MCRMFSRVHESCIAWTMRNDKLLDSMEKEQFDVAVVDGNIFYKCIYLIPHRLHVPWITYNDILDPLVARVPWLPSFVPNEFLAYSETMTFSQRLTNSVIMLAFSLVFPLTSFNPPPEVVDKYQQYGSFSSVNELVSRSVLWLQTKNSIVLDYPRPMMPNIIDVGGLTVKPATRKLPPDIKEFIEGAQNGVILMTFGTKVASIPVVIAEKFLSSFRRLDGYRVIWRMRNTDELIIPDNVMISQWLPQNEILAHPSVKLFITHCGNNGQFEAVYHGVPMIGFPVAGSQVYNAKRLDHKGYGLSMDLHDFTADQLLDNIHKIMGDKSCKERVMKASDIFRSQAQSPVERAAFWIEHVCRFGGDHLHSAGNDLPLYSYLMLDVLAFILVALHALVFLLFILARLVLRECCRQRKLTADATKKHN